LRRAGAQSCGSALPCNCTTTSGAAACSPRGAAPPAAASTTLRRAAAAAALTSHAYLLFLLLAILTPLHCPQGDRGRGLRRRQPCRFVARSQGARGGGRAAPSRSPTA
jgi:hypothetical protein